MENKQQSTAYLANTTRKQCNSLSFDPPFFTESKPTETARSPSKLRKHCQNVMSADNAEKLSPVYSQKDPLFSLRTKLDTFYFLYCVLHLVITCLIDIVLVVPRKYLTEFQLNLINFHISEYKDFLLQDPPKWLVLFGWIEVLFQLPLFLFGAIALYQRRSKVYPYLFVYGIEASLTTLVCMVVIALNGEAHGMTTEEIQKLEMLYAPILAISVFLSVDMLFNRIWYDSTTTEKKQI